jgi:hypothetical protein
MGTRTGTTTGTTTTGPRRAVLAVIAAAGLATGLAGCAASAGPESGTALEDLQAEGAVVDDAGEAEVAGAGDDDTELFLPDKASYLGREVTVSGRVVEVFSPHAFVIGEDDLATLVTRGDTALAVEPGVTAQVTGTVARFVLVDAEAELGTDLVDADLDEFESVPHLRAHNVNLLDSGD